MYKSDTICAVSTPSGLGGIGIIRISGDRAHEVAKKIFLPKRQDLNTFSSHKMYLGYIVDPESSEVIDEVLLVFMRSPKTYTKEDMAEIHAHGGYLAQKRILEILLKEGVRLADPGEFTKRAFLNGRIDLIQAESVLDIIRSETEEELRCAISYLKGRLSEKLNDIKEKIKDVLIFLEASIDFPEEDIFFEKDRIEKSIEDVIGEVQGLIESYYEGRAIRDGLELLIIGRPNVGKSSILNALLKKQRAIVTPIPGTTRDLIEDTLYIKGIKVKIVDSCGLRDPKDEIEEEGIRRVKEKIEMVELVLFVLDGSRPYSEEDEEILSLISKKRFLTVINKIDLPQSLEREILSQRSLEWIEISALNEIGLDQLKEKIYERLMGRDIGTDRILITNLRHKEALNNALSALKKAKKGIEEGLSPEFPAFDLYEALNYLSEITGERVKEDIVNQIFERFCIGK